MKQIFSHLYSYMYSQNFYKVSLILIYLSIILIYNYKEFEFD